MKAKVLDIVSYHLLKENQVTQDSKFNQGNVPRDICEIAQEMYCLCQRAAHD